MPASAEVTNLTAKPRREFSGPQRLRGVEIFAAGVHRDGGTPYSPADLDDMVANHKRHKHLVRAPLAIGHEEAQRFASTDVPKFGDAEDLSAQWRTCTVCGGKRQVDGEACPTCQGVGQQYVLSADFAEVPGPIRRLIESKTYDSVSSEVYNRPPHGLPGKGKMLRRVSLLGGQLPEIKSLADLTRAVFEPHSEARNTGWRPAALRLSRTVLHPDTDSFEIFSEVRPMTKPEMVEQLKGKGYKPEMLDQMPDDHLAELCRVHADQKPPGGPTNDTLAGGGGDDVLGPSPEALKKYSEETRKTLRALNAQIIAEETKKIASQLQVAARLDGETASARHKDGLETFCEQQVKEGKVAPAEMDRTSGRPTLLDRLLRADATVIVAQYSENGRKVAKTELELQMDEIKRRPVLFKYGETVKSGKAGAAGGGSEDPQVEQLESHFEQFAEQYQKNDLTKEALVNGFNLERKQNPSLTAQEYLNAA